MKRLVAAAVLLLSIQGNARAYVREKDPTTGVELNWQYLPLSYAVNSSCAGTDVDRAACLEAVRRSFEVWAEPSCTVLEFEPMVETDRTDVGYIQDPLADNINLIIWHFDGWPYDASALAITTSTYRVADGVILDTDMEANGAGFQFRIVIASSEPYVDIQNTITHEAGHFVGLDHVGDPGATMYPTAPDGEMSKRDLSQDDIAGVCAIYPVEGYDAGAAGNGGGSGGGSGSGGIMGGGRPGGTGTYEEGAFDDGSGCGCTTLHY
jgi:uncharacterized membrane protein YgcG